MLDAREVVKVRQKKGPHCRQSGNVESPKHPGSSFTQVNRVTQFSTQSKEILAMALHDFAFLFTSLTSVPTLLLLPHLL